MFHLNAQNQVCTFVILVLSNPWPSCHNDGTIKHFQTKFKPYKTYTVTHQTWRMWRWIPHVKCLNLIGRWLSLIHLCSSLEVEEFDHKIWNSTKLWLVSARHKFWTTNPKVEANRSNNIKFKNVTPIKLKVACCYKKNLC